MENRAHALVAGLFALVLGVATILAIWWFSGERETLRTYELVSTDSVSGLNPQAQVRFRGIAAGKVINIRIDPLDARNILVTIGLRADLPVTRGTRASLGYQGVTGLAYVQLDDRGEDPTPLTGVEGRPPRLRLEPGLLDQLSDTALDAVQSFKTISEQMAVFFDEDNLARFRSTLERLESAAVGVDRTFAEAPETLQAIRTVFSPANMRSLSNTLANFEHMSDEAAPAAAEMRALMQRLGGVLDTVDDLAIAAGDSLMDNTLPQLNGLLKELTDTSARLGRLIDEVEASPQILITGRSERKPGPGESGFQAQHQ